MSPKPNNTLASINLKENAFKLIHNATQLLNITQAYENLQEGKVRETAHNLTEANHIIAQLYQLLKNYGTTQMKVRMYNYFKIIGKLVNATRGIAKRLNITAGNLEQLINQAKTDLQNCNWKTALHNLIQARNHIFNIEQHGHGKHKFGFKG